jgi:hypothetical protein
LVNCKINTASLEGEASAQATEVLVFFDSALKITANDFGSSKTNPGQHPKHHFCCGDMGKKVKYHKRRDLGK